METQRLSAPEGIAEAARLLRAGALVAFPTETVYGLGALALEALAVRGIYAAKGRPANNPLIVHVLGAEAARALAADWPALAQRLCDAFWPGPLTLVLPRTSQVPDEVTAGGPTVAIRAPSHPVARALLAAVGAPLAAPSANRAEHVSPTLASHALADLDGRIDAVLDGGPCALGIESTVLQLAPSGPRLLRAGAISRAQLERWCGPIAVGAEAGSVAPSPGLQARHYAPAGWVKLAPVPGLWAWVHGAPAPPGPLGALVYSDAGAALPARIVRLPADAAGYAHGLYAGLRELEAHGCRSIAVEAVPEGPEWEAIADRLQRAAG